MKLDTTTQLVRPEQSEVERLREALRQIDVGLGLYHLCNGHISRDDMRGIIMDAQARIDSVRGIVWPEDFSDVEIKP